MKSLDMFCASQAATAICMSLEKHVVPSSATIHLGSARCEPITESSRRGTSSSKSSQKKLKHGRKSISLKLNHGDENLVKCNTREDKSSGQATERKSSESLVDSVRRRSCIRLSAYFTPGSKRYRLAESKSYPPHSDRILALVPTATKNVTDQRAGGKPVRASVLKNETPLFVPSADKYYSPFRTLSDQVVVVAVSLHCKGCAGKVKKHISKMQGVTSFDVNFDARKVTVVGDVTQMEVLASISKVRTTQVLLLPEKPSDVKQVIRDIREGIAN